MKYTIKNIRHLRKERHMTQEEFAEMLDMSVNSIRNWESGEYVPTMDKIQEICETLGCDLDYLFGIIPQKTYLLTDFADKTGLSSEAITVLCNMRPNRIENLSYLITNERFQEILGRLSDYGGLSIVEAKASEGKNARLAMDALDGQMLETTKMKNQFDRMIEDYQAYKLKKWEDEKDGD